MKQKLEASVLALAGALAAMVLLASTAAAVSFHSEFGHTGIGGFRSKKTSIPSTSAASKCEEIVYPGTMAAAESETIRLTPSFVNCSAFGFINTAVDASGCEWVLYAPNTNVEISCEAGKASTVTGFSCWVKVASQTLQGATSPTKEPGKRETSGCK
jgi:hypothetical protein